MNDLVLSAKNGNRDALLQLYGKHKNGIYYFCTKIIDEKSKAEELCYDTFICAFEKISTLSDTDQFEMWIKNIAAIKCFNYIRKMKPMLFLQVVGDPEKVLFTKEEIENLPHGELDKSTSTELMDEIFNRLNDDQRMTLMLRYYNGLTVTQTAKIMNCSEDIVKIRMGKGAETMKNAVTTLEDEGVKITPVDFKTVMGLMAALTAVPKSIDARIENIIDIYSSEDIVEQAEDTDDMTKVFPVLSDPEFGTLEEATLKYSAGASPSAENSFGSAGALGTDREMRESIYERFMEKPEVTPATHDFSAFEADTKVPEKTAKPKQKFTISPKFKVTAAALAVIIILIIIISSFSNCSKKSETTSSETVSSAPAKPVVSSEPAAPVAPDPKTAEVKVTYSDMEDSYSAKDGTVLAEAKYQCPVVSVDGFSDCADKINDVFKKESEAVIATYQSDEEKLKCDYMYEHQDYGAFKKNFNNVTVESGKCGDGIVSFMKTYNSYAYGNTHDITEIKGATYSVKTGKQMKISDLFDDVDAYYKKAEKFCNNHLEDLKDDGKIVLYDDYATTVRATLEEKDSWYITDDSIIVIFNADEVAYYDYGTVKVQIPLSSLPEMSIQ